MIQNARWVKSQIPSAAPTHQGGFASLSVVPTVCSFCNTSCGMLVHVEDGRIARVEGNPEHPLNGRTLCVKAKAAEQVVHHPDRLQHPMVREGERFKRVSWGEALDLMADRLKEIREKHGPEALLLYRGAATSAERTDGFLQFMALYGSPNATGVSHLCFVPRMAALNTVYGTFEGWRDEPDYERAECIVVWGANPLDTMRMGLFAAYEGFTRVFAKAKERGAKLITVNPRQVSLGAEVDEWVAVKPGTDLAFALALLNVIMGEGLYDEEFVRRFAKGFEELGEHVKKYTPEWAEEVTGVSAEQVRRVARTYATAKPSCILDGNGLDMHSNVFQTVRAIGILRAVTGNLDAPGGNVFFPWPDESPYPTIAPDTSRRLGAATHPMFVELFKEAPFPLVVDAILTGSPYQPRAMIVHHANPLLTNANPGRVKEALEKLDFLVVYDIFETATARLAHLVLPDTTCFERLSYRTYPSARGGFIALRQRAVEPVGEARPFYEVEYALAKRMGFADRYLWSTGEEWVNYKLKPCGLTVEDLRRRPIVYTTPPIRYRKYEERGFNTPSGRVELYSGRLRSLGLDPLPAYTPLPESGLEDAELRKRYPLLATTRKPPMYVHSKFRNIPVLRAMQPAPQLRVHPVDAEARGVKNGGACTVESPYGEEEVEARVTEEVKQGVVVIDYGWGNPWDGEPNANLLATDRYRDSATTSTPNILFPCEVRARGRA